MRPPPKPTVRIAGIEMRHIAPWRIHFVSFEIITIDAARDFSPSQNQTDDNRPDS